MRIVSSSLIGSIGGGLWLELILASISQPWSPSDSHLEQLLHDFVDGPQYPLAGEREPFGISGDLPIEFNQGFGLHSQHKPHEVLLGQQPIIDDTHSIHIASSPHPGIQTQGITETSVHQQSAVAGPAQNQQTSSDGFPWPTQSYIASHQQNPDATVLTTSNTLPASSSSYALQSQRGNVEDLRKIQTNAGFHPGVQTQGDTYPSSHQQNTLIGPSQKRRSRYASSPWETQCNPADHQKDLYAKSLNTLPASSSNHAQQGLNDIYKALFDMQTTTSFHLSQAHTWTSPKPPTIPVQTQLDQYGSTSWATNLYPAVIHEDSHTSEVPPSNARPVSSTKRSRQGFNSQHQSNQQTQDWSLGPEVDSNTKFTYITRKLLKDAHHAPIDAFNNLWMLDPRPRMVMGMYSQLNQPFTMELERVYQETFRVHTFLFQSTKIGRYMARYTSSSSGCFVQLLNSGGTLLGLRKIKSQIEKLLIMFWYCHEVLLDDLGLQWTTVDQWQLRAWLWDVLFKPKSLCQPSGGLPVIGFAPPMDLEEVNESKLGPAERLLIESLTLPVSSRQVDATATKLIYLYMGNKVAHIPRYANEEKFRISLIRAVFKHQREVMDHEKEAKALQARSKYKLRTKVDDSGDKESRLVEISD